MPAVSLSTGSDIYTEALGTGPTVLMMHGGLGLDHTYLRDSFDRLSAGNKVIYYDHFGNGRSSRPADYAEMSFDRLAADAAALLDHYGEEKAIVIGHSYGGFIAQEFASRYGERLSGLALISTVPAFDYQPAVSGTEEQMAAFGALFGGPMGSDDGFREVWNVVVQMYFKEFDPDLGAKLDGATTYAADAWNAGAGLLASYNTLEALPNVSAPAFVAGGAHDGICPLEPGVDRLATLLPNATKAVFDVSAHYPFLEEEDAFFAALTEWLAEIS